MTNNSTDKILSTSATSEAITVVQYLFYSVIVLVGLVGNTLVCKVILCQRRRRPNEYFILNLAITDLGTCGLSVPFDMIEQLSGRFLMGAFLCRFIYPLQTLFMSTSVFTLLCVSIERYRAIVLPLEPKLRGRTAKLMLLATWVISLGLVTPYISVLVYDIDKEQCLENWPDNPHYVKAFTCSVFILLYLIPLSIIIACYFRVLFRLYHDKSHIVRLMGGNRRSHSERLIRQRAEQNLRMVKLFVTAVTAFALCYLPFHVLWLWNDFGDGGNNPYFSIVLAFCNILAYSNSIINPFIFGKLELRRCCKGKMGGFFSLRSNSTVSSCETSSFRISRSFAMKRHSRGSTSSSQV